MTLMSNTDVDFIVALQRKVVDSNLSTTKEKELVNVWSFYRASAH